jgi:hypothetical protein
MRNDKEAHALRANKIFEQSSQRAYDNYTFKKLLSGKDGIRRRYAIEY